MVTGFRKINKMKKITYLIIGLASLTLCGMAGFQKQASPETQTKAIVTAANDFLNSLTAEQRKAVQFEFLRPKVATGTQFNMGNMQRGPGGPPNARPPGNRDTSRRPPNGGQRGGNGQGGGQPSSGEQYGKAVWSNFPVNITPRPGIELGSLNAKQRTAATRLVQLLLSAKGYEKVQQIMGSDEALRIAGTDVTAGSDHYLIGIFGTPDATKPWMVEFGGHHLGLNVVIAGKQGALTPTLTGAQPAVYTANGKTIRVLAQENDKAFDLLNTLDETEKKKAILNYHIGDLVLGPGHDGQTIVPEGIKGSQMTVKQKEMLLSLITEWAGIINNAYQDAHLADIKAGLDETYFAWSGPVTHAAGRNGTAYYRIQGPKVIIEFAPQATMGDTDNHIHTIYRDPSNEYGNAYVTQ
jgi:hypothetical protein